MSGETNLFCSNSITPLLKADQVSKLLGISLAFTYRLMQTGQIRTVKIGRSRRVRAEDLSTYIHQNLQNPPDSE